MGAASPWIDFLGFGKSDGDSGATTVDSQLADAEAAFAALAAMERVETDRIGVLGFSLGGGVAMFLAARRPEVVKALATWASVGDSCADFLEELGQDAFAKAASDGFWALIWAGAPSPSRETILYRLDVNDLTEAISSCSGPFLSSSGELDFAAAYAPGFLAASPAILKEAPIVPGGDHIHQVIFLSSSMAESVIRDKAEWLAGAF